MTTTIARRARALDREIVTALDDLVGEASGGVAGLERRPLPHRSSFTIEELDVRLRDGSRLRWVLKDLGGGPDGWSGWSHKPVFLRDPLREIEIYRDVLDGVAWGTPAFHGAVTDPASGRFWLFLERVRGVELWQIGSIETWLEAARWLARFHARTAEGSGPIEGAERLVRHDDAYYEAWLDRAVEFVGESRPAAGNERDLVWLADRYRRAVDRMARLPRSLLHGEFYPSNIIVAPTAGRTRICPVDWENAGLGPSLADLAALVSGGWTVAERGTIAGAYRDAFAAAHGRPPVGLLADLDCCRLQQAVQWLGWSRDWTPPPHQAHDWLATAFELAERVGS